MFCPSSLEALYLGTPAIISDIPAHVEVYRNLPVEFFRAGDADDLISKLIEHRTIDMDLKSVIQSMYNYADAADAILSTIKTFIDA